MLAPKRTNAVNAASTMVIRRPVCHSPDMAPRPRSAGGFFLIIAILAGFGFGVAQGDVVKWTMLGTLAGIVLALLVWLLDRRAGL